MVDSPEAESPSAEGDGNVDADAGTDVLEYRQTPLNACSLETCCNSPQNDKDGQTSDSQPSFIPLCMGCYQLNESTGQREGRLDLYAVPIHQSSDDEGGSSFRTLGEHPPLTVLGGDDERDEKEPAPGILDGKWANSAEISSSLEGGGFFNYYATAHANGEIWVHEVRESSARSEKTKQVSPSNPLEARLTGKSDSPSSTEGLCLALAWETPLYGYRETDGTGDGLDTRIISSYSDGHTAIHRIRQQPSENDTTSPSLELTLEHHWASHKMFTCPAEVWCANFVDANTVVTGGDEGSWKIWDLRMPLITNRPVHHGTDDFGAGVTVLAPHPRNPKLLAVGSYDETVALFDLRKTTAGGGTPEALYHSESLGGGIWRCKWHPYQDHKLLVAAMHGGCVVGAFDNLESHVGDGAASGDLPPSCEAVDFRVQKEFKVHKSMAYGIDWLASGGTGGADAAASCSFYDKAMYLWNAN